MLLQVHADTAKEHSRTAHIRFIWMRWRIYRDKGDVVMTREKLTGDRIVAGTAPAVHPARAGGDLDHPHRVMTRAARFETPGRETGTRRCFPREAGASSS